MHNRASLSTAAEGKERKKRLVPELQLACAVRGVPCARLQLRVRAKGGKCGEVVVKRAIWNAYETLHIFETFSGSLQSGQVGRKAG
jgi:hypothetical protein